MTTTYDRKALTSDTETGPADAAFAEGFDFNRALADSYAADRVYDRATGRAEAINEITAAVIRAANVIDDPCVRARFLTAFSAAFTEAH